jgi:energy-coupling factor transporter ATP-binding protein EcfA2
VKVIESIRLVQFFLYEKEEIRVGEITGIFGANGSGKSSLLDAVQIAMFGANERLAALNAQADEETATTRSLRAYCLGQYGETIEHRYRDTATTYITLVWRDTETKEPVSTGVCLFASADREKHDVLGRYILRGMELTLGDHLEVIDGKERPQAWATFRHQLVERSRATGDDPVFDSAESYIRQLLLALRGSGGVPAYDSFVRAFRFGLRMRFDKSVDRIVREDVLEAHPTNIRKFKEVTESFRRLAEMVAQVEKKIADGAVIEADFARAEEEDRHQASWEALAGAAAAEEAGDISNKAVARRQDAEEALQQKTEQCATAEAKALAAQEESRRLRALREAHSAHREHGALQSDITRHRETAARKERELCAQFGLIRRTLGEVAQSPHLVEIKPDVSAQADSLGQLAARLPEVGQESLHDGARQAVKVIARAADLMFKARRGIENDLSVNDAKLKTAKDALARTLEGKAPLSDDIQRLLAELRDKGVQPQPVCDLVKVTEPEWQPVIESYLGRRVEGLMVTAKEEGAAFAAYRGLAGQRAIYGAKLVVEERIETSFSAKPGSVAELITGENRSAVAYLRRQFGDIMRAGTDREALAGARTLTKDGMLVGAGEIDRLRPTAVGSLKIGAGSGEQRDALRAEVARLQREMSRLYDESEKAKKLNDALIMLADEARVLAFVDEAWGEMRSSAAAAESLTLKLASAADEEYVRLGKDEAAKEAEARELAEQLPGLQQAVGAAKSALGTLSVEEQKAAQAWALLVAQEKTLRDKPNYDPAFAERQWDSLLKKRGEGLGEMRTYCLRRGKEAESSKNSAIQRGTAALGGFITTYREQVSPELAGDWRRAQAWLAEVLKRLRDTELDRFRADMEVAYRASQETFRNDVAIALHTNIEALDATMSRLNKVLLSCPAFTNGERYQFRRTVRAELSGLLTFIKNVAEYGAQDDLLGGPGEMPEEFRLLLDEKTAPGAAGMRSPLDDYREFFEFDIDILREDPDTRSNKRVGSLSKRLGPGSGGEHRAPLYVIAGAALASAYRMNQGGGDGMRLIVLDEVFNKMDLANIIASMRYLESLGMQVLMASPGENLGALTAFMDRYYEIMRDPASNAILIEGHNVTAETRALFRDDLPEFNPDLVEEEVAARRALPMDAPPLSAGQAG